MLGFRNFIMSFISVSRASSSVMDSNGNPMTNVEYEPRKPTAAGSPLLGYRIISYEPAPVAAIASVEFTV